MAPLMVRQAPPGCAHRLLSLPKPSDTYRTGGYSTSTAPMSQAQPLGRFSPRWSEAGQPALSPASITGLLGSGCCVAVNPPLGCSGPSCGAMPTMSFMAIENPQELSLDRLCPLLVIPPEH